MLPREDGGRDDTGEGGFDFGDELTSDSCPLSSCLKRGFRKLKIGIL